MFYCQEIANNAKQMLSVQWCVERNEKQILNSTSDKVCFLLSYSAIYAPRTILKRNMVRGAYYKTKVDKCNGALNFPMTGYS
jgi:hypothetical protein